MIKPMGKELRSDAHFIAAILEEKPVVVKYLDGAIADYGSLIELIKGRGIKINGMYYLKDNCRFFLL